MKLKTKINFAEKSDVFEPRNNQHFRIRSTSKDKFLSTIWKSKEKYFLQPEQQKRYAKNTFTQKLKNSHKELRKIVFHQKHQRQRSGNVQSLNQKQSLNSNANSNDYKAYATQQKDKAVYQNVKTQECHLSRKKWVDINSIDTSEDIKILDRITSFYDPFRMINQCNSKARIQRRSAEQRIKSISVKKSKLTDKINTLVFQMASKSKSKNGFKIHRNKFEDLNPPIRQDQQKQKSCQKQTSCENSQNKVVRKSPHAKLCRNSFKAVSLLPKQLEISTQLVQKKIQLQINSDKTYSQRINKNLLSKQNSKNQFMDNFWNEVNQSLILAAQEQYVSKDLNQLLYNNIH